MSAHRRVALVTGASQGIGQAIVDVLAAHEITAIGASLSGRNGCLALDVRDEPSVERVIARIVAEHGRLDVLVNNAGIASNTPIVDCSLSDWRDTIDTNLTGPFLCSKHALRHFVAHHGGVIVNVASIAGRSISVTASEAYTTSKAGLVGLTRQLAWRYAAANIRVNCVCPSQTHTSMLAAAVAPTRIEELAMRHPMQRLARPSEVAEVVGFLVSEAASYVNGAIVDVHGGQAFVS